MYDCAIVGTGPAGLSAALNLKLHNKSIIWFGSKELSNKISNAESIANYPGFPYISGNDLRNAFCDHIEKMNIEITDAMVTMISSAGNIFMLLADNQVYKAKSVILATGVVSTRLLNNEDAFVGRGLSYCATCDGFLYNGKTIAVLCKSKRLNTKFYILQSWQKKYIYLPNMMIAL